MKRKMKRKKRRKRRECIYMGAEPHTPRSRQRRHIYMGPFPWGIKILLSFFLCLCYYMDDKVCVPAFDYEQEE